MSITFNQFTDEWEAKLDGVVVATSINVCSLCEKYRGCDFTNTKCGVLS